MEQGAGRHVDSDPKWGEMMTGGSWSVWQSFPVLSRAGAAGRIALIEEGAKLLGVSPQRCTARNGAVHRKRKIDPLWRYRSARRSAADYTPDQLKTIPIKQAADRRLIGQDTMALDVPSKTNGKGSLWLDAVVEGMIYARPKFHPPDTTRRWFRSTIRRRSACPDTFRALPWTTLRARRQAGSWSMRTVSRQPIGRPIS